MIESSDSESEIVWENDADSVAVLTSTYNLKMIELKYNWIEFINWIYELYLWIEFMNWISIELNRF